MYRLFGGRFVGRIGKAPVLLLTTRGRKTGKQRTTPLLYVAYGDALVVVASNGGAPRHPAWYLNLQAEPEIDVQVGREQRAVRAREATEEERTQLWAQLVAVYRGYEGYAQKANRTIPIVVLEPR
jgi:deazaflavin-dependent oxidoreductase (nitroreductase family)